MFSGPLYVFQCFVSFCCFLFVCLFVCLFGCFYFHFLSFCFILFLLLLLLLLSVCRFTASDYPFLIFKLSHITEIELYSPINLLLIGVYALTSNIKFITLSAVFSSNSFKFIVNNYFDLHCVCTKKHNIILLSD